MLTDVSVRSAKTKDKPYKLTDEKSLYLLIPATGGKLWRFDYRYFGKRKTLALGSYPEISLAKARELRDEARKLLASDVDPGEVKKASRVSRVTNINNSFEVVAREWINNRMADKSPSHRDRVLRRFEIHLFPWIGNQTLSDISAVDVLNCAKRVQMLNKLETAHRLIQSAGQVFRYGVHTGRCLRDVTPDLKGALPNARIKHMAAFTEPEDVGELLRAIEGFTGTFVVQSALRLAPLVFVRPGELRKAKWSEIDLDSAEWRYKVSKTKTDHIVPLSNQAIQILKELYPLTGHREFVFTGGHDPKKPMSEAAINAALKRMGYDTQTQITGHGFRAMARTILHERLLIDPYIIEHQLAHRVPDALGSAYNRTKFLEQRKEMMQRWADYLDELKG